VATPESARLIGSLLGRDPKARIVVCGGGLTGLELAAEVAESHPAADVSLVTRGELAGWLSPRARDYVRKSMEALGVHVLDDTSVTRVESGSVETSRGDTPFDLCLWAGGFVVPQLAARAGLEVDRNGRVITDLSMRSVSDEAVYALGDAAAVSGSWGDSLAYGCRTGGFTAPTAADAVVAQLTGRPTPTLKFRYIHECLSLGRKHHVIQFLDKDGAVRARTRRGRKARMYKDLVLDSGRWTVKHAGPYKPVRRRHIVSAGATSGITESLRRSVS
jgi:NADH dehydrogenase FAD-containing subunit